MNPSVPSGARLSGCLPLLVPVPLSLLVSLHVWPSGVPLSECLSSLVPFHLFRRVLSGVRLSGCLYSSSFIRFSNLATALRLLITFLSSLVS